MRKSAFKFRLREGQVKHMQTKLTTKSKKGSHIHNQSPILSGCSRFQNTASLRFSPESRRTCFSCRLGDVGISKRSLFEGRLRHMCTVPYTEQQRQQSKKTVTKTMTTCTYCYYSCYNNGRLCSQKRKIQSSLSSQNTIYQSNVSLDDSSVYIF